MYKAIMQIFFSLEELCALHVLLFIYFFLCFIGDSPVIVNSDSLNVVI